MFLRLATCFAVQTANAPADQLRRPDGRRAPGRWLAFAAVGTLINAARFQHAH